MSSLVYQYPCREGHTGLEVEHVRHHYSRLTPSYGTRLVDAVLTALNEAVTHAAEEVRAALKIQATFRMYVQAKAFREIRHKACAIQRVYRGYVTRQRLAQERTTVLQRAYLQTVFDVFATRIQACFRGYQSRKTRSNYYAQKAYIQTVTARATEVLEEARKTRVEQDEMRSAESQRVHALAYARRTARLHHTVSTCEIPSVYYRPLRTAGQSAFAEEPPRAKSHGKGGGSVSVDAVTEMRELAEEDRVIAQVAAYTAGEKLEEDIRQHSRAARHGRIKALKTSTASPSSGAASVAKSTEPRWTKQPAAPKPTPGTRLPALHTPASARLDNAGASSKPAHSTDLTSSSPSPAVVPWELASARPPERPPVAREEAHAAFSHTAPATSMSRKAKQEAPHSTAHAALRDDASATAEVGAATSSRAHGHLLSTRGVSSFSPKFGVRSHDCLPHDLTCEAGVTQRSGAASVPRGTLSTEKEDAAIQRSVNAQVVKALHGDAVFRIPAARGKRTADMIGLVQKKL